MQVYTTTTSVITVYSETTEPKTESTQSNRVEKASLRLNPLSTCNKLFVAIPRFEIKGDIDILALLIERNLLKKNLEISKPTLDMFPVLQEVEQRLPELLADRSRWKSLFIDYQPPYLYRIFCDLESEALEGKKVRACLHYFLPAKETELKADDVEKSSGDSGENLYHPHAWASCMRILEGSYDQDLGYADRCGINAEPPKLCQTTHGPGDSYQMNHPWLWHQVNPRPNLPVSTLMVTHIPEGWDQEKPQSTKTLRTLTEEELDFMFAHFVKLLI
ncbi:MAG: hypothetical protein KDK72_03380 [Chlamydiia bacterium]|nr:hypothetical protein [Chlamydiia bacterium]